MGVPLLTSASLIAGTLAALVDVSPAAASPTVSCTTTCTQVLSETGSAATWTVPAGVESIDATLYGADGGAAPVGVATGGLGAEVAAAVAVTGGETLTVNVGGAGTPTAGGYNGGGPAAAFSDGLTTSPVSGGGGGATSLVEGTTPLLVAGGGGGGGFPGFLGTSLSPNSLGGDGGNADEAGMTAQSLQSANTPTTVTLYGGGGGGSGDTGGQGGLAGASVPLLTDADTSDSCAPSADGDAGNSSSGGTGGGGLLGGGADAGGGGGGGGYAGGGQGGEGASDFCGDSAGSGGGGGGSSYGSGTGVTGYSLDDSPTSPGTGGNGEAIISYQDPIIPGSPQYKDIAGQTLAIPEASGLLAAATWPSSDDVNVSAVSGETTAAGGTVTINMDGSCSYTPPNGFSGTDTFSYIINSNDAQGDYANGTATVTVKALASPSLMTTPSPASVALGASSVTLTDSAVLSGGNSPTGTVTFTLYDSSTMVDTETVTVSGNGTYTTPAGYTLPSTGTVTGTYQWDATYSGDTNNNPATDNNNSNEQVTVSTASPGLTTTPSATSITLGTTAPTLNDSATLSSGYYPTGSVTFTLYNPSGTLVYTDTVPVSAGSASTTSGNDPGGYKLPSTSIQVTGPYQWNATYGGDNNNNPAADTNDPSEVVAVTATGQLGYGFGWYTPSAGAGSTGFDFVVAQVPKSSYWGELRVDTANKWLFQANVTSFSITSPTQGQLAGTGNLYQWVPSLNRGGGGWQLSASGVTYKATANAKTKTAAASFGITINSAAAGLPNSTPMPLTRGAITIF